MTNDELTNDELWTLQRRVLNLLKYDKITVSKAHEAFIELSDGIVPGLPEAEDVPLWPECEEQMKEEQLYEQVLDKLEQFKANQIKFRRPSDLASALIFALKRHDGHGDCKTVTGVAQILGIENGN